MSGGVPWWYSGGGDDPGPDTSDASGARRGSSLPRFDLGGLASGAQQLVDFARQALLAPHAGHEDPRDHPDCMICRTMTAVGDVRGATSMRSGAPDRPGIQWITLDPPRR